MLQIRNSKIAYGFIAIVFHWVIAALIIFLLGLGIYMTRVHNASVEQYYVLHKALGVIGLGLVMLRIIWWCIELKPILDNMPQWQITIAKFTHFVLYTFMLAMPLTGLFMSFTANKTVSVFGWFIVSPLLSPNAYLKDIFKFMHNWIGYSFIVIVILHVLAAAQHHFILKDDVFKRMLPRFKK